MIWRFPHLYLEAFDKGIDTTLWTDLLILGAKGWDFDYYFKVHGEYPQGNL